MRNPLKQVLTKDIDRTAAQETASQVAALLKSKIQPNNRVIADEPYCPYKVPVHTDEFYCFVYVSDASFGFNAQRRPKKGSVADFFVSLKFPAPEMFAERSVPAASRLIGVDVFRQPFCAEEDLSATLLSKRLMQLFAKLDLKRVSRFHLSPEQLSATFSCQSAQACVKQVLVFRDLITTAFEEAYKRNHKGKS